MARIMIDDLLCFPLSAAAEVASVHTPVFACYRAGQLLRESISINSVPVLPEADDMLTCSITAMERPTSAIAHELPSIGSLGHERGLCNPCGFMHHTGGCAAGVSCSFCHLCPAGTIEKQRKKKRQLRRAAQHTQNCQGSMGSSTRSASPTDASPTPPEPDDASQCSTTDTHGSRAETPRLGVANLAIDSQSALAFQGSVLDPFSSALQGQTCTPEYMESQAAELGRTTCVSELGQGLTNPADFAVAAAVAAAAAKAEMESDTKMEAKMDWQDQQTARLLGVSVLDLPRYRSPVQ